MQTVKSPWFRHFETQDGRIFFLGMVGEKVPRVTHFLVSFASEHELINVNLQIFP